MNLNPHNEVLSRKPPPPQGGEECHRHRIRDGRMNAQRIPVDHATHNSQASLPADNPPVGRPHASPTMRFAAPSSHLTRTWLHVRHVASRPTPSRRSPDMRRIRRRAESSQRGISSASSGTANTSTAIVHQTGNRIVGRHWNATIQIATPSRDVTRTAARNENTRMTAGHASYLRGHEYTVNTRIIARHSSRRGRTAAFSGRIEVMTVTMDTIVARRTPAIRVPRSYHMKYTSTYSEHVSRTSNTRPHSSLSWANGESFILRSLILSAARSRCARSPGSRAYMRRVIASASRSAMRRMLSATRSAVLSFGQAKDPGSAFSCRRRAMLRLIFPCPRSDRIRIRSLVMFRVIRSSLGATITHNPMSSRHRVMPLREYCRVPRQGDDDRSGRQPSCLRRMSVIADTSPRGGMRPLSYTVTNTIPSCMPSWYRNAIHMSYVHVWKQRYRLRHAGIIPWSTTASHGRYPGIRQAASMSCTPHAHRTAAAACGGTTPLPRSRS